MQSPALFYCDLLWGRITLKTNRKTFRLATFIAQIKTPASQVWLPPKCMTYFLKKLVIKPAKTVWLLTSLLCQHYPKVES